MRNIRTTTSNIRALVVVFASKQRHDSQAKQMLTITRVLIKTQDYLEMFSRFKQADVVTSMEDMLRAYQDVLERYERSQLGGLSGMKL